MEGCPRRNRPRYYWREVVNENNLFEDRTRYRPKHPDSPFIHISDLVNPETDKTYREENAELVHTIPIGMLVEIKHSGVRLFVVYHGRDCDMTPLYSLAADPDDVVRQRPGFGNWKWHNGYSENCLTVIDRCTDKTIDYRGRA